MFGLWQNLGKKPLSEKQAELEQAISDGPEDIPVSTVVDQTAPELPLAPPPRGNGRGSKRTTEVAMTIPHKNAKTLPSKIS